MFIKAGKECNYIRWNMPLYFWPCVLWKVLCGCFFGARFIPRWREIEVVVWWQREDEGWIRVRLASDSARCGRGEKKGEEGACCGRKPWRKRLIWCVKPSQKSICITTDRPALPPELSFKGAPSPTLSQRWIAICVLDMQGGWCRLECSFKIHNGNGGAKNPHLYNWRSVWLVAVLTIQSNGLVGMFSSFSAKSHTDTWHKTNSIKMPFKNVLFVCIMNCISHSCKITFLYLKWLELLTFFYIYFNACDNSIALTTFDDSV